MIYQIATELGAALRAQNVPFGVVFGPEPTESLSSTKERVVVEQPIDEKRDRVGGPKAIHPNPRMPLTRFQAVRIRIFARSSLAGAQWHDHAERAEEVLDHVLGELDYIVRGRRNTMSFTEGGFIALKDEKETLVWSGAVYEQDVVIDRGIFRRTWAHEANEEVTIGTDVTIENTVKVSSALGPAGDPPPDAEIASGG